MFQPTKGGYNILRNFCSIALIFKDIVKWSNAMSSNILGAFFSRIKRKKSSQNEWGMQKISIMGGSMFYIIFTQRPYFFLMMIFTYNTSIESYEHLDYVGLKNKGSTAKIT